MLHNVVDYFRKQNLSRFFARDRVEMHELSKQTLHSQGEDDEDCEYADLGLEVTDKKIAFRAMYFSLAILTATIFFQYRSFHVSAVEASLESARTTLTKYSWFLVPLVCGVLSSAFTVFIVYKDSRVPGEDPPTPFSPSHKHRRNLGYNFHLNYIFAVGFGLLVFMQMLYSQL